MRGLLEWHAAQTPNAAALVAPSREALTYAGLLAQVERSRAVLQAAGIRRTDRVAVVLPNGPEMAAAFVAIACGATTAPLNPAYRAEEFDFYLSDLNAKALVILEGMGRGVESNIDAEFSCDAVNLAMIKDSAVASRHAGKVFDVVCRFWPMR